MDKVTYRFTIEIADWAKSKMTTHGGASTSLQFGVYAKHDCFTGPLPRLDACFEKDFVDYIPGQSTYVVDLVMDAASEGGKLQPGDVELRTWARASAGLASDKETISLPGAGLPVPVCVLPDRPPERNFCVTGVNPAPQDVPLLVQGYARVAMEARISSILAIYGN